jgi:hypothetical protein
MRRRILMLCCLVVCLHAQPDPSDLLRRVTEKTLETVSRLPKYMCTQTIGRSQFEPAAGVSGHSCARGNGGEELINMLPGGEKGRQLRLTTSDRLRLDVAVSGGHELYSWVGESHFEDRSLFELVSTGAISTGSFASFLMVVFRDDAASFSYKGEVAEEGRQLAEFEFHVPVPSSHYIFSGNGKHVTTGYFGSILVEPKTADLVRMTVHTEALPPETGSCESSTTLDYSRVSLHNADFLLPNRTQLHILGANGVNLENSTVYSNCHEFLGESTLRFDPAAEPDAVAVSRSASGANELPAGLPFTIALSNNLDQTTAAAGDKIGAKITTAVKAKNGQILILKGAAVTARILQVRRYYLPEPSLKLVLKLETVDIDGTARPLIAQPDSRAVATRLDNQDPKAAVLYFKDTKGTFVASSGSESSWLTVAR